VSDFDAERMLGYAIFKDGKSAKLQYPLENFLSDVAGRSFHIGPANSAGWYPNLFCQLGAGELQPFVSKSWTWSTEIRCVLDVPGQKVPSVSNGEMAPCLKHTKAPQVTKILFERVFMWNITKQWKSLMFEISICFSLFWFIRKIKQITYLRPSWIAWCFHFCNWQREHKNNDRHEHASFLQWGMHLTGGGMTVALSHIVLLYVRDLLRPQLNDTSSFANIPSPSTSCVR